MIKEAIAAGKDLDEARANAALALGADELADVQYEILDLGKKGFLGFGSSPAKVRAYIELPGDDPAPRREERAAHSSDRHRHSRPNHARGEHREREDYAKEAPKSKLPEAELEYEPKTVEAGQDLSFDFVNQLIANLGIEASASLFVCKTEAGRKIIVDGKDSSMLIGHHGETLNALQYLANLASAKKNKDGERNRDHVIIDIEGYRAKREEALRVLARRMARRALKNNRNVTLEPMSAYERRIIHSELQNMEGVTTASIGTDENRKVVIHVVKRGEALPAPEPETANDDE